MQSDWRKVPALAALAQKYGFSGPEMNKVLYHRNRMSKPFHDPHGDPVTIYATGIEIPEGPNKGKQVSVPGYIGRDGKGRIESDAARLYAYWSKDINAGRWPVYDTPDQLNQRDAYMHRVVMDRDMKRKRKK